MADFTFVSENAIFVNISPILALKFTNQSSKRDALSTIDWIYAY